MSTQGGTLERVELDESILDDDAHCGARGCTRVATWSGKGACGHPIRACEPHHLRLASGMIPGVRCRCGEAIHYWTMTWVRI